MQIQALLVAVCVFCVADLVNAACKQMKFDQKDLIDGKALQGHVFKAEKASDERHCRAKCFIENQCISYNYGLDKNNENNMCELNDADHVMHPTKLIGRQGTVYARAENNCSLCESFQVCTVNWVDKTQQCGCKPRFTGARCEIEIKPCDSSPCQNQGNCTNHPTEFEFSCKCNTNFTGVYCESRVDPCLSNPCQNDGTCQALMSNTKYSCQCTNEFIGVNCHIPNPCSSNPCLNDGTCDVKADYSGYTCSCGPFHAGDNCETVTSTCASGPCKNGGTCVPDGGGYTCTCPATALGADCGTAVIIPSGNDGGWQDGNNACKAKGTNLPIIHSAAENLVAKKLYDIVQSHMWIGLRKNDNGIWQWSDGTSLDYENWESGVHQNKKCAYMNWEGKWGREVCTYTKKYLCV